MFRVGRERDWVSVSVESAGVEFFEVRPLLDSVSRASDRPSMSSRLFAAIEVRPLVSSYSRASASVSCLSPSRGADRGSEGLAEVGK